MKTFIVMSGGNTKGYYQAGALKKIEEKGTKIDGVYGVSVGAVNALGFCFGNGHKVCEIWESLKETSDIFQKNSWFSLAKNILPTYNLTPIETKIEEYFLTNPSPRMPGIVSYYDLWTDELLYANCMEMGRNEFLKWTLASASEPPFIEAQKDDETGEVRYSDGGIIDQTPLKKPIDDGADRIWVILTKPYKDKLKHWKPSWPTAIKVGLRAIQALSHDNFVTDIKLCKAKNKDPMYKHIDIKFICPSEVMVDDFEINPEAIKKGIDMGYKDADTFYTQKE